MDTSVSQIDSRIAALRDEIRRLLEREPDDLEGETAIVEQLTQRNEELENLAKERDVLAQAVAAKGN